MVKRKSRVKKQNSKKWFEKNVTTAAATSAITAAGKHIMIQEHTPHPTFHLNPSPALLVTACNFACHRLSLTATLTRCCSITNWKRQAESSRKGQRGEKGWRKE